MMKKSMALILLMMVLFTSVFAAETLEFDGYPDYEKDDYIAEHQVSISNITGESETAINDSATYFCQAPVDVTLLDSIDVFYVAPLVLSDDGVTYNTAGFYAPNGEFRNEDYWSNWESLMEEGLFGKENDVITITEPGIYYVCACYTAISGGVDVVLIVDGESDADAPAEEIAPAPAEPETVYAYYTTSTVLVDGVPVEFEAYNINNNNYFKLRDIAMAFKGKDAEFSVFWSEADNSIIIDDWAEYEPVGGELAKGDGTDKTAIVSSASVLEPMDGGFWPQLTVYNINGNNYFKLRDLGFFMEFNVDWDAANSSVIINTVSDFIFPENYSFE